MVPTLLIYALAISLQLCSCDNIKKDYSKETQKDFFIDEQYNADFRNIQRPYRVAKLNLVWTKAQHKLTEPKLKSLYMELKIHDKEEIAWKQLNSQHHDKDGIKAAELRQKLIGIMSSYDLLEHFEDTEDLQKIKLYRKYHDKSDDYLNKSMFKDKKLNKLWEKAEIGGFSADELNILKQEFHHHQDKVDIYYNLLDNLDSEKMADHDENAVNEDELDSFNEIYKPDDKQINNDNAVYVDGVTKLRNHHTQVKDNIDRLERLVSRGPHSQDFIEPKVQGLWRIAMNSNFSDKELTSLKSELHHYESRLLKLRHLHSEHALHLEKYKKQKHKDKTDRFEEMDDLIKKQTRKVEKLQDNIESKIFKHSEL